MTWRLGITASHSWFRKSADQVQHGKCHRHEERSNVISKKLSRRRFLAQSAALSGAAAALTGCSFEEKALLAHQDEGDEDESLLNQKPVKGLAMGKIKDVKISRVIIGSNLFGGGAHARNLKYVSELMFRYFTEEKILDTLQLCEANGINTNIGDPYMVNLYNKERGGKMQVIGQLDPGDYDWSDDKYTDGRISITKEDIRETVEEAAKEGCVGAFLLGCRGDRWVKVKRFDMLEEFVSCVKKNGMIAGIGGHDKSVPIECEKAGIDVDFYFKTIHPESYWGAIKEEDKRPFVVDSFGPYDTDCMWELYPQETIDFMKTVKKPWIGYKVLAAGAVHPEEAFRFAFENGTDFACVGMFDFQVRDNVKTAIEILAAKEVKNRARKWA